MTKVHNFIFQLLMCFCMWTQYQLEFNFINQSAHSKSTYYKCESSCLCSM